MKGQKASLTGHHMMPVWQFKLSKDRLRIRMYIYQLSLIRRPQTLRASQEMSQPPGQSEICENGYGSGRKSATRRDLSKAPAKNPLTVFMAIHNASS
jgi:hypothetical protein